MKHKWIVSAVAITFLTGCAVQQLSGLQKRQIESKELKGTYRECFKATMTVLQDNAYLLRQSDMNSGLLVAVADKQVPAGEACIGAAFAGMAAKRGSVYELSANFEEAAPDTTRIRMTIQEVAYNMAGGRICSNPVINQELMAHLYNEIQLEVNRREMLHIGDTSVAPSGPQPVQMTIPQPDQKLPEGQPK